MTAEPRDLEPTPAPAQNIAVEDAAPSRDTAPSGAAPGADSAPAQERPQSGLSLVDVRRLWPDLLESVKLKRRFTWIMLSQNAQVAAVDDKTLTVALLNAGARDSFLRSGSDEILRQAAIDVIGQDWRIETIVDSSAQPGAEPDAAPRITSSAVSGTPAATAPGPNPDAAPAPDPTPPPDWATGGPTSAEAQQAPPGHTATDPNGAQETPARQPVDPAVIASARGSIQPTRAAGAGGPRQPSVSDEDAHPDDPDADDHDLGGAQLLERELGARVIEEIKHD